jgi:hypothetical protein
MAGNHGARQQKRAAKQKAKRAAKRSKLQIRTSPDANIRLQSAEKWPVAGACAGADLWKDGIGYLVIARRVSEGQLVFASFMVDVHCLGVKDTFWEAGTRLDFDDLIQQMAATQRMRPIAPAALVKIVTGAVDYARSFGFSPHPDYRHSSMLLAGIDPTTCTEHFTFGHNGRPLYIQGPNESSAQALAIMRRVKDAEGQFLIGTPGASINILPGIEGEFEQGDSFDEDDFNVDDESDDEPENRS